MSVMRKSLFNDDTQEYIGHFFEDDDPPQVKRVSSTESLADQRESLTESEAEEERLEKERLKYNQELQLGNKIQSPIEWYSARLVNPNLRFDLELWWRRSDATTRSAVILLVFLCALTLAQFILAVAVIISYYTTTVGSPFVCHTKQCENAAEYISRGMDQNVDPCENIYEFVCGNYKERKGTEIPFVDLIHAPAFKMELKTTNAFLAKILRQYNDDTERIKFYKACIGEQTTKKTHGVEPFYEIVEKVFGTRDFKTFENSSTSLEEIGANLFRAMGQAVFVNIAFASYPYIKIISPDMSFYFQEYTSTSISTMHPFVKGVLDNVMVGLGIQDNETLVEMYRGIKIMHTVITRIDKVTHEWDKSNMDSHLENDFITNMGKICPPMGMRLNITKMLELFLKEKFKVDYLDWSTRKYIRALDKCFSEDPSSYQFKLEDDYQILLYPKTAFVATWIFGLFYDFVPAMESYFLDDWGLRENYTTFIKPIFKENEHLLWGFSPELRCLHSLFYFFGYRTSLKFVADHAQDPQNYIYDFKEAIEKLYEEAREIFWNIPGTEIGFKMACAIQGVFLRTFHTDVVMPLLGGILDDSADLINFTDSHLSNSFKAVSYTVEKARNYWSGSTDVTPVMKWWAHGTFSIHGFFYPARGRLLNFHKPLILPSQLAESEWDKDNTTIRKFKSFLGRQLPNYVLYPVPISQEPHHNETLAIHVGAVTYRLVRAMFALAEEVLPAFLSYETFDLSKVNDHVVVNETMKSEADVQNRSCSMLKTSFFEEFHTSDLYKPRHTMLDTNVINFTWHQHTDFLSLLALKEAFRYYRAETKKLEKIPYIWSLPRQPKIFKRQRILPGRTMKKYNEDQLFFLSFVRHACRVHWKDEDDHKGERYELEATVLGLLMQMEEFSDAFKCGKNSFMNNQGKDRCFKYKPASEPIGRGIVCSNKTITGSSINLAK